MRRRARLRNQIEVLQRVFDHSPVMISCYDADGRFIFANREWERVLGWKLEEARERDILFAIYPDSEERRRAQEMVGDGQERWTEFRGRTRDGRNIEMSWTRVVLSDGTRLGFGVDVTGRRHAEAAVRESELRFHAIFEQALDAIMIIDDAGNFVDVNPAACTLLARDRETVLHLRIADVTGEGFEFKSAIQALLHTGTLEGEWALLRPDGSVRHVEFTARAHFVPGQHLGVLRDVTDRKRLEAALRTSEVYLNEGQRLSHTGSWAWNVRSGELFWSAETYRIFGLDPEEGVPSYDSFLRRLHPEDAERVGAEIERATRDGADFESSYRIVGPSGSVRHLHSLGHPVLGSQGAVAEYVGVVTDVTDRRTVEEQLRRSFDELRRLSGRLRMVREEERRRIARDVHDEVGQALTALHMDVAWLENRMASLRVAARPELLEKLASMSVLLATTLESVQRISNELRPGVLDELGLEAAVEWYAREFEKRAGIVCRTSAVVDPERLDSDRSTAAFRILQEALTNVARHSGAASVDVRLRCDARGLVLEVQDDGRGILSRQAEDAYSLGLLGMRERARALGGQVTIRSDSRRGTRVRLNFPP